MNTQLFSLIVFLNLFQFSLYAFSEELFQHMLEQDYEAMTYEIEKTTYEDIVEPVTPWHDFFMDVYFEEYTKKLCLNKGDWQNDVLGLTIFHVAAVLGDVSALKILLDKYPNCVDVKAYFGLTPLSFACRPNDGKKRLKVVDLLLKSGAKINRVSSGDLFLQYVEMNPLANACMAGNLSLVKFLLSQGASVKHLHACIFSRCSALSLHKIIKKGGDEARKVLSIIELLFQYCDKSDVERLQLYLKNALLGQMVWWMLDGEINDCNKKNRGYEKGKLISAMNAKWRHTTDESMIERIWNDDVMFLSQRVLKSQKKIKIISREDLCFFITTLKSLIDMHYSLFEIAYPIAIPVSESNRSIILKQLEPCKKQQSLIKSKNVVHTLRNREIGNKVPGRLTRR